MYALIRWSAVSMIVLLPVLTLRAQDASTTQPAVESADIGTDPATTRPAAPTTAPAAAAEGREPLFDDGPPDARQDQSNRTRRSTRRGGGGEPQQGELVATQIDWMACDFVVNVWHNGKLIPPGQRKLVAEIYGATRESFTTQIREGDWLVFQVVHNQMRWNGVRLFVGHLSLADELVLESRAAAPWYVCDTLEDVEGFVKEYDSGKEHVATEIPKDKLWDGIGRYRSAFPASEAQPIWGEQPMTWIKLRVPAPRQSDDRPRRR